MEELLEIARNAREHVRNSEDRLSNEDKDRVISELLELSPSDFDGFFNELFGEKLLEHCESFYQIIYNLQFYIGYRGKSDAVFSKLWVHAYQKIESTAQQEAFLNELSNDNKRYIWNMQSSLPGFCEKVELAPAFAAVWFCELAEKVKNDLAGEVNEAIEGYTKAHPSSALEILKIYESQLSDNTTRGLGGFILGLLRGLKKKEVQEIDCRLKISEDVNVRACYYNSIFMSYKDGALTLDQLSASLEEMLKDDSEDVNDIAFWTVNRCLVVNIAGFSEFGIAWFNKNCSSSISGNSKYNVISCMWHICRPKKEEGRIDYKIANKIIATVLPVSNEHLGTLDRLEFYLRDRIESVSEYEATIFNFVESGIENLLCLFEHERFDHFKSELSKIDLTHLITELVFSGDSNKCKLGFLFIERSKFTPYTAKTLVEVKEENAFIALEQLRRDRSYNQTIAKKVQFLEPFFRNVCKELQDDFVNEVVVQAVNYSQGCLKEIKRFGRSKLIKAVIVRAEQYFDGFEKAANSPANSFNFPGYKEECFRADRRMNAEIQKQAKEKSVFMRFASSVHLIYGNKFSSLVRDSVGDATPMAHIEHSMELPRLELIDPEGMAIRRINANKQ